MASFTQYVKANNMSKGISFTVPPKPKESREVLMDSIKQISNLALKIPKFQYAQSTVVEGKHIEIKISITSDDSKKYNVQETG